MKTLIIAGGDLKPDFLAETVEEERPELVIAADRGLDACARAGIVPGLILGDYDSVHKASPGTYKEEGVEVLTYRAEKDFSDSEAAVQEAIDRGADTIIMLGACGGRQDHFLANVAGLLVPLKKGVHAEIRDELNRIFLADRSFKIGPGEKFGKYLSLLALTETVLHVTLTGVKYPLSDGEIHLGSTLSLSNEILGEEAVISFSKGIMIVIMSKDSGKS